MPSLLLHATQVTIKKTLSCSTNQVLIVDSSDLPFSGLTVIHKTKRRFLKDLTTEERKEEELELMTNLMLTG